MQCGNISDVSSACTLTIFSLSRTAVRLWTRFHFAINARYRSASRRRFRRDLQPSNSVMPLRELFGGRSCRFLRRASANPALQMHEQQRNRCRCDARYARCLAQRLGTMLVEFLLHFDRQPAHAQVIDVVRQQRVLVFFVARDLVLLARRCSPDTSPEFRSARRLAASSTDGPAAGNVISVGYVTFGRRNKSSERVFALDRLTQYAFAVLAGDAPSDSPTSISGARVRGSTASRLRANCPALVVDHTQAAADFGQTHIRVVFAQLTADTRRGS